MEETRDAAFQDAWLKHLIALELGAVELAQAAVDDAQNAELAAFAKRDLAAHQDRLDELKTHADA